MILYQIISTNPPQWDHFLYILQTHYLPFHSRCTTTPSAHTTSVSRIFLVPEKWKHVYQSHGWKKCHSFRMDEYFSDSVCDLAISFIRFLNLWLQSPPLQMSTDNTKELMTVLSFFQTLYYYRKQNESEIISTDDKMNQMVDRIRYQ